MRFPTELKQKLNKRIRIVGQRFLAVGIGYRASTSLQTKVLQYVCICCLFAATVCECVLSVPLTTYWLIVVGVTGGMTKARFVLNCIRAHNVFDEQSVEVIWESFLPNSLQLECSQKLWLLSCIYSRSNYENCSDLIRIKTLSKNFWINLGNIKCPYLYSLNIYYRFIAHIPFIIHTQ